MTKDEAERAVRDELIKRKLSAPMSPADLLLFSIEMSKRLQFRTHSDPQSDIRAWAEKYFDTLR